MDKGPWEGMGHANNEWRYLQGREEHSNVEIGLPLGGGGTGGVASNEAEASGGMGGGAWGSCVDSLIMVMNAKYDGDRPSRFFSS